MATATEQYDCIIIGGGPAGLSAAIYAGREGMRTLVLDKTAFGGMAALTETIDNYPGFSRGVGGQALIDEMVAQAERFNAVLEPYVEVAAIEPGAAGWTVLGGDTAYRTKAILIATGSEYRRLEVPGEAELIGRGVHFCATCDGPLYKDKRIVVVGGGNSALQESLFLARFGRQVDILVRGEALSGSDVLQREVAIEPRIEVHYGVQVASLRRRSPGGPIAITYPAKATPGPALADGVFVFVGLLPNTHGLTGVATDDRGFVTSDHHYGTHRPGVFVAGDVRSGSTWQIGAAVGEGVSAALIIRQYLDTAFAGWHKR